MDIRALAIRAKELLLSSDKADKIVDSAFGFDGVTVSMLLGSGRRAARSRAAIYSKWHYMAGDPIISAALRLHVTQALGGHETTGQVVFIEKRPGADAEGEKLAKAINKDLSALFNRVAYSAAFNAAAFGDSYARIYAKDRAGVLDIYTDEMVYPPLVQPFEQGNKTVGYTISTGSKFTEKLTIKQLARLKMPRLLYTAQLNVIEKSFRTAITEDDHDKLPILPAIAGGSLLDGAEESYDNLTAALTGLVGQRVLNSINETMIGVNMEGMTKEQQEAFMKSMKAMLQASKSRAEQAVKDGKPLLERLYHLMPTFGDKQLIRVDGFNSGQGGSNITTEDVFLHARMLAGALGMDLTMLGFADQLSGGLGDGGFFRVSAQAAERSRIIRTGLCNFFDSIVDIHTMSKWGFVLPDGQRPYQVNFYGSISALETENQKTQESAINTGVTLIGVMAQIREMGLPQDASKYILSKIVEMDDYAAKLLVSTMRPDAVSRQ